MDTQTAPPTTADPHALDPTDGPIMREELALAFRNRGMPLEALRHDRTPTGLHYLVAHWDIPATDADGWQLTVGGAVREALTLTVDDVRARPSRTLPVTLECAGNGRGWLTPRPVSLPWLGEGVGTATWTGVPLRAVLDAAGPVTDACEVVFRGRDRGLQGDEEQAYARSLPLEEAMRPEILVAYGMNGGPLPPQHGFPLRLIVPGWYGMASVKWLEAIEVVTAPFDGFQQSVAYRYQQDGDSAGQPVSRMRPRALMIPPGVPDFFTRHRFVTAGTVALSGRAWSGHGVVTRVEVAVDGHWADATLDAPVGRFAWRGWRFPWRAEPGDHRLACRATDAAGHVQPLDAPWNHQGMGNNMVHRVDVTVR